jgi:hypothetical protein
MGLHAPHWQGMRGQHALQTHLLLEVHGLAVVCCLYSVGRPSRRRCLLPGTPWSSQAIPLSLQVQDLAMLAVEPLSLFFHDVRRVVRVSSLRHICSAAGENFAVWTDKTPVIA